MDVQCIDSTRTANKPSCRYLIASDSTAVVEYALTLTDTNPLESFFRLAGSLSVFHIKRQQSITEVGMNSLFNRHNYSPAIVYFRKYLKCKEESNKVTLS
jgi:hypothetical protein